MNSNWVTSTGGSLICSMAKVGSEWRGVHGSSANSPHTDHDRACGVLDYLVPCGESEALVLSDEPLQTIFAVVEQKVVIVDGYPADLKRARQK